MPNSKPEFKEIAPNVFQIYEYGGAVGTLTDIIEAIKEKKIRNFAVIAQKDGDGEISTFGDPKREPAKPGDVVTQYYFYGVDHLTQVSGLIRRLDHIIHKYMDGEDIFGDDG